MPLVALILGSVLTGAVAWFITRPSAPHLSRLMVTPSPISALTVSGNNRDLAIAPDGTHIVYVGTGGTQMFVRAMDRLEPTPFTGLGFPVDPFFSPDGNWIGFANANVDLRKVGVTGGPPVTLCPLDGAQSRGATWADDGTIVFATSGPTDLQKCSADGGTSMVLTTPNRERGEADHLWPEFLPGGHALLFTITQAAGGIDAAQVAVLDLRTGTQKILFRGGTHAHYVQSGHLVYAAAGTLRAVPFDPDRLQVGTTPQVPVLSQLATTGAGGLNLTSHGRGHSCTCQAVFKHWRERSSGSIGRGARSSLRRRREHIYILDSRQMGRVSHLTSAIRTTTSGSGI